jgi:hypothetical protein
MLYAILVFTLLWSPTCSVLEVTGVLSIRHDLDLLHMRHILRLWSGDPVLSEMGGKMPGLVAGHRTLEMNVLINVLVTEVAKRETTVLEGFDSHGKNGSGGGQTDSGKRVKRNFLGDILHTLTGVATDDQLQAQLKLDQEIRQKVSHIMTKQVTFERDLTDAVTNLGREEEELSTNIDLLRDSVARRMSAVLRLITYEALIDSDMEMLLDSVTALSRGVPPVRLSSYLSHKCGIPALLDFKLDEVLSTSKGVSFLYAASLYTKGIIQTISARDNQSSLLTTTSHQYLVLPSHPEEAPLVLEEVNTYLIYYLLLYICLPPISTWLFCTKYY